MLGTRIDGKGNLIGVGGPYEEFSKAHVRKNVRFGSLAAATSVKPRVRFTPKSCRDTRRPARQLRANTGHRAGIFAGHLSRSQTRILGRGSLTGLRCA
jgi:hypothetical protein